MAICINCGKKIGFNTVGYYFDGKKCICDSCYDKVKALSSTRSYKNYQEYIENKKAINQEMEGYQFHQEAIDYVNSYLDRRGKDVVESELALQRKERLDSITPDDIKNFMVTTGFDFEGYEVDQYLDVVTGESVLGTGMFSETAASLADILGTKSETFTSKLEYVREDAMRILKMNCIAAGGNASLGVSLNFVMFTNNMIGVIASGTAVRIKKK